MDLKGESKDQLPGSTVDLQVEVPDLSTMPKRKLVIDKLYDTNNVWLIFFLSYT